jgi:hypothetical protein
MLPATAADARPGASAGQIQCWIAGLVLLR